MQSPVQSNYPRYSQHGPHLVPPGPKCIRFAALGEAWELIRADFNLYAIAVLLYGVITQGASLILNAFTQPLVGAFDPSRDSLSTWFAKFATISAIPMFFANAIGFILGAGLFSICLRRLRGEPATVANLFDGFQAFIPLTIASAAIFLLKMLGFVLLIVPGLYAVGIYAFVAMIILDQKLSASDAMRLSADTLRAHWLSMAALSFVLYVVGCLGIVACGIGVLFTGPVYFMGLAIHYHAFFPPAAQVDANPWQSAPTFSV